MTIYSQLEDLVAEINDRGINATMDPRNADAPGAIVDLDELTTDGTLCGRITANAVVWLIAPDNGHPAAVAELLELFSRVDDLTTGATVAELALPETAPLPALRLNPIQLEE